MLAIQNRQKYFSKVMTLPNGVKALVYFELVERNGHLIARAIHAETIQAETLSQSAVLALPALSVSEHITPVKNYFQEILTPYFKDFSFVMSQPTRAPSF